MNEINEPEYPPQGTIICDCTPEGKAEAAARMERCREALGNPEPADFLSRLIMELNWQYQAWVSMIAADQWFGIRVEQFDAGQKYRVECDRVEDGLVAAWEFFSKTCSPGAGFKAALAPGKVTESEKRP